AGDVGEIAASAMLTALRLAGCPTRVHEEKRRLCGHGLGPDPLPAITLEEIVDNVVATFHKRLSARISSWVALPDQHLLDGATVLGRFLGGDIGFFLLVLEAAVPVVGVHRD